jgi:hypothetical protein
MTTLSFETPELGPEHPELTARLLYLTQPEARAALLYVFYVNGQFCYDRQQVRWIMGRLGDPYIYFSKVEAFAVCPLATTDLTPAIEQCQRLLREALPVLVAEYYPDDRELRQR